MKPDEEDSDFKTNKIRFKTFNIKTKQAKEQKIFISAAFKQIEEMVKYVQVKISDLAKVSHTTNRVPLQTLNSKQEFIFFF